VIQSSGLGQQNVVSSKFNILNEEIQFSEHGKFEVIKLRTRKFSECVLFLNS
jgi:hypothetical protein